MQYKSLEELNENDIINLYESTIIELPYYTLDFSCKVGGVCKCGGTGSWKREEFNDCILFLQEQNPSETIDCYSSSSECTSAGYCAAVVRGGRCS